MKKEFLKYKEFNEQYLPYFGVKQALDDSLDPEDSDDRNKNVDFKLSYSMDSKWWGKWKSDNADKGYSIKKDDVLNTYKVSKNDEVIFIYDIKRNKIFTNRKPNELEEEATMVGVGTLTPTSGPDSNIKTGGYRNTTDSSSAGSHPVY